MRRLLRGVLHPLQLRHVFWIKLCGLQCVLLAQALLESLEQVLRCRQIGFLLVLSSFFTSYFITVSTNWHLNGAILFPVENMSLINLSINEILSKAGPDKFLTSLNISRTPVFIIRMNITVSSTISNFHFLVDHTMPRGLCTRLLIPASQVWEIPRVAS